MYVSEYVITRGPPRSYRSRSRFPRTPVTTSWTRLDPYRTRGRREYFIEEIGLQDGRDPPTVKSLGVPDTPICPLPLRNPP